MYSVEVGEPTPVRSRLLSALGSYLDPTIGPEWDRRTVFEQPDLDHLTVKMYTITPDCQKHLGMGTQYVRVRG